MNNTHRDPHIISYRAELPFQYSAGKEASKFFAELRDHKRILATKCEECGRAFVPPRPVCGYCYRPCEEWVEVGPEGVIIGATVVMHPFLDPLTGEMRPVPYGYGNIQFDGAFTKILHFIDETEINKLEPGLRVTPVFKEKRVGNFGDIQYFKVIKE